VTDTLDTLQAPTNYTASTTAYNPSGDPGGTSGRRWGDYSYTSVDPNDDMTMWTIQEFCDAANSYGVRVVKLFAPPPATPASTVPSSVMQGSNNVDVLVTGTQVGGSGFFDPGAGFSNRLSAAVNGGGVTVNSVTYSNPAIATLNITVTGGAALGARTVTVTNPDGQSVTSVSGILTITSSGPTFNLNVSKTGLGTGTITSSPAGIDCGATCSASFSSNAVVQLSATAGSNSAFTGWSGAASGSASPVMVTMLSNMVVTANFSGSPVIVGNGATVTAEGCSPTNGVIDPNETVTVNFSLQNVGSADTSNLVATLLATNGVASPSGPQTYGLLTVGGAAVAEPFTFTANGTCGGSLIAGLQLQDGTNNLGTVTYNFTLGVFTVATNTFANSATITIPASGTGATTGAPSAPYPSAINVSALSGPISKVTVTLTNMNHTFPDDIDILLVGPGGQSVILMSDTGGSLDLVNVTLTFDDSAASSLPDSTQITSGTYKPTNIGTGDPFPAPASTNLLGTTLSVFNGTNPNGTWSLYVVDDAAVDTGNIAKGWKITIITTTNACCVGSAPPVANFSGSPTNGTQPLVVTFSDASTGTITNRFWDFGDSSTTNTTTNSLVHTYAAGTYTVTLVASGPAGVSTNTQASYITVNPPAPVASFTGIPTNGTEPLVVMFSDASTGSITNRLWDFGDSTTTNITTTSAAHTYAAGSYNVTLIVSGPGGSSTNIQPNYIGVLTAFQSWQIQYFSSTNNPAAFPTADPDGDGCNNLCEFLAGTDPTDPNSALRITSIVTGEADVVVSFTSSTNKLYDLQFNDDLTLSNWNAAVTNVPGTGTITSATDLGAASLTNRFYRVRLVP
jgi:PKD repeat protein